MNYQSFLITFCVIILSACAAPTVSQRVLMPAHESSMAKSRTLAVLDFDGDYDGVFRGRLESFLTNVRVNGQPYFTVVERRALDNVLREQNMGRDGRLDSGGAVHVGRLSGAQTMLMGTAQEPRTEFNRFQKKVEECVQYDNRNKCIETVTRIKHCRKRTSYFRFTMKAVSVERGSIGFSRDYAASASSSRCRGDQQRLRPAVQLEQQAMQRAIAKIRRDVAPYSVVLRISLMPADKVVAADKQAKANFNSGLKMANQGSFNRGCAVFKSLLMQHKTSPALNYNMGVCAEISGNLDEAKNFFIHADRNTSKPNKLITSSIQRIERKKINQERVDSQMN